MSRMSRFVALGCVLSLCLSLKPLVVHSNSGDLLEVIKGSIQLFKVFKEFMPSTVRGVPEAWFVGFSVGALWRFNKRLRQREPVVVEDRATSPIKYTE